MRGERAMIGSERACVVALTFESDDRAAGVSESLRCLPWGVGDLAALHVARFRVKKAALSGNFGGIFGSFGGSILG